MPEFRFHGLEGNSKRISAALTKRELKIFITFFLVFSFFVHWTGWVEDSYFDLTRSIADEGRLQIDSYYNNTGDRAFYDGHYYSNKAPGMSFLAVPVYTAWKFLYQNLFSGSIAPGSESITRLFSGVPVVSYFYPGFFVMTSMALVTIFTSSLFSALNVLLVYKISRHLAKKESHRLLITLAYALGTIAFPYATVFFGNSIGTFFAFLSFYLLFDSKMKRIKDSKHVFLAGISAGFAFMSEYSTLFILAGLLFYAYSIGKMKGLGFFAKGLFIGLLPLLLYNFFIFNNPFEFTISYSQQELFPPISQFNLPNLYVILRLLVFPYRGLLFYSPILILSLIALFRMRKTFAAETLLIAYIFLAFAVYFSTLSWWWGGTAFGARYLLPTVPFLMVPLAACEKKSALVPALVAISIFIGFLGAQVWENKIADPKTILLPASYAESVNSFQVLGNPIYDYYLPLFLENGPRSRIIENLPGSHDDFDIRDTPLSKTEEFPPASVFLFSAPIAGIVLLKLPFLSLFILAALTFLIWKTEISRAMKKHVGRINEKSLFVIAIAVGMLFVSSSNVFYKDGWYQEGNYDNMTYRWMSQDATLLIYNHGGNEKPMNLTFSVLSLVESQTLEIYLNGNLSGVYEAHKYYTDSAINLELRPGENTLTFHSNEGCRGPESDEWNKDLRCLSFAFKNMAFNI